MAIIKQIEASKKTDYDDKQTAIQFAFNGYNQAIDDVLDILKAEFEPKDMPDSEGWWLRKTNNKCDVMVFIEKDNSEPDYPAFVFWEAGAHHYPEHYIDSKWIKVMTGSEVSDAV